MVNGTKTIWSATPTPFLGDGRLDLAGIERVVDRHVALGVAGLLVGGTCGEGPLMPNAQRDQLFAAMKKHAGSRLTIAAQISDTSAARVRDNLERACDNGADCVVIAPPWLVANFCNKDYLRRYFLEPLDASTKPVGIYVRMPLGTMALNLELWREIIAHPMVALVKDSTSCPVHRAVFADIRKDRPTLTILTGDEFDVMNAIEAGYDGCLMGTGILNARLIRRGLEALAQGDRAAADAWQQRSNALLLDLFRSDISCWMSGLKYALKLIGLFSSEFSHLAFPLNEDDKRRIESALAREADFIAAETK